MEFWVVILIVLVIVGFVGLIIAIVLTHSNRQNSNGDYNDGGGKQVGSPGQATFFMSTAEARGIDGERLSNFQIRKLLRNDEYLLSNLLIPIRDGHKTEIDSVIVSRKGVFCIETKNWVGKIYGDDRKETWTQVYDDPNRLPRTHQNPVIQNERHCGMLDHILHGHFTVNGVVLFVNDYTDYYVVSSSCFTISQFKNYYRKLPDSELSIDQVKQVFQMLYKYIATEKELREYKETLRH